MTPFERRGREKATWREAARLLGFHVSEARCYWWTPEAAVNPAACVGGVSAAGSGALKFEPVALMAFE